MGGCILFELKGEGWSVGGSAYRLILRKIAEVLVRQPQYERLSRWLTDEQDELGSPTLLEYLYLEGITVRNRQAIVKAIPEAVSEFEKMGPAIWKDPNDFFEYLKLFRELSDQCERFYRLNPQALAAPPAKGEPSGPVP